MATELNNQEKSARDLATVKRNRLILLATVFVGIMSLSGYVVWTEYDASHEDIERFEQQRLDGIAKTLALQINGDDYEEILNKFPDRNSIKTNDQEPKYDAIHNALKAAKDANEIATDIYTLSMYAGSSVENPSEAFFFGITSSDPYYRDPYQKPPLQLFDLYLSGGVVDVFSSENGTWVAAVAPIKTTAGEVVGIVEVDKQIDEVLAEGERQFQDVLIRVGTITLVVLLIAFSLTYLITRRMVLNLQAIIRSTDENNQVYDKLSAFADEIGKGNYESDSGEVATMDNTLSKALISMRENLQESKVAETKRNWAIQGQADFGELLREFNDELTQLCQSVISNMVKYLKAHQGLLYVATEENETTFLELTGSFAANDEQLSRKRIDLREGLVGQCFSECTTMNLQDVPKEFTQIESGLGSAQPLNVVIVPLMHFENPQGVMEICGFRTFEPFEIKFIEEVAKSIGSSIVLVKGNEKTAKLLEESKDMTERLQVTEEDMRQKSEELTAIQEELQRRVQELEASLKKNKENEDNGES